MGIVPHSLLDIQFGLDDQRKKVTVSHGEDTLYFYVKDIDTKETTYFYLDADQASALATYIIEHIEHGR